MKKLHAVLIVLLFAAVQLLAWAEGVTDAVVPTEPAATQQIEINQIEIKQIEIIETLIPQQAEPTPEPTPTAEATSSTVKLCILEFPDPRAWEPRDEEIELKFRVLGADSYQWQRMTVYSDEELAKMEEEEEEPEWTDISGETSYCLKLKNKPSTMTYTYRCVAYVENNCVMSESVRLVSRSLSLWIRQEEPTWQEYMAALGVTDLSDAEAQGDEPPAEDTIETTADAATATAEDTVETTLDADTTTAENTVETAVDDTTTTAENTVETTADAATATADDTVETTSDDTTTAFDDTVETTSDAATQTTDEANDSPNAQNVSLWVECMLRGDEWSHDEEQIPLTFRVANAQSYQWQRLSLVEEDAKWQDIPDVCGDTLILNNDSSAALFQYRCIARQGDKAIRSDEVALVSPEITEWVAQMQPDEVMYRRALNARSLESVVLEGMYMVYVRTGEALAQYDPQAGTLTALDSGEVFAILDKASQMIYPSSGK